jgi:hypothetical protein
MNFFQPTLGGRCDRHVSIKPCRECAEEAATNWRSTGALRFAQPQGSSTSPPVLQQKWVSGSGAEEWRSVPLDVVSIEEYLK